MGGVSPRKVSVLRPARSAGLRQRILDVIDETGPRSRPYLSRVFGEAGERVLARLLAEGVLVVKGKKRGTVVRRPKARRA